MAEIQVLESPPKSPGTSLPQKPAGEASREKIATIPKSPTQESANKEPSYESIKSNAEKLAAEFSGSQALNMGERRGFARKARELTAQFHAFMRKVGYDQIDALYPDRREPYKQIEEVLFNSLDGIPFNEMSEEERNEYIKVLSNHLPDIPTFNKKSHGYYHFGLSYPSEPSNEQRLLEKIVEDRSLILTPEQEEKIFQTEEEIFKLHLNVPPQNALEVLKTFLKLKGEDIRIWKQIDDEIKARGEQRNATLAERRERGSQLTTLGFWKMSADAPLKEDKRFADFVFYVLGKGKNAHEALPQTVCEIGQIVSKLNLPENTEAPRYSTPVVIDGKKVNGLFLVEGDGDFKDYLLRTGGEEKLAKFYDPDTNYALQRGLKLEFKTT